MKALDFNALAQPTWQVTLKDEAHTVVNLSAPTVHLIDRLLAAAPELQEATKAKDGRITRKVYELAADLMSYNEDGYKFTSDELMTKYNLTFLDVLRFANGYLEFIKEITDAKN